jgi:TPR repeat protein
MTNNHEVRDAFAQFDALIERSSLGTESARKLLPRGQVQFVRQLADLFEVLDQGQPADHGATASLMRMLTDTALGNPRVVSQLLGVLRDAGIAPEIAVLVTGAAINNDIAAMVNLGMFLVEHGHQEEAGRWFVRAAEAGDAGAMNNLAVLLADQDPDQARHWYQRAAEAGNVTAMANLGLLLADQDPDQARHWFAQAGKAGDTVAMVNLGLLLVEHGHQEEARQWYRRAAEAGDIAAMANLGLLLADQDPDQARHWYQRAAEAGNVAAMANLGLLLADQEPGQARHWFAQAAEAGDAGAMNNLAVLLADQDPDQARHWYQRAAEAGNVTAMANLGLLLARQVPSQARHRSQQGTASAAVASPGDPAKPSVTPGWFERATSGQPRTSPTDQGARGVNAIRPPMAGEAVQAGLPARVSLPASLDHEQEMETRVR